jgi:hypothetical protein
MLSLPVVGRFLSILSLIACACLILKLWRQNLVRTYLFFFLYLLYDLLATTFWMIFVPKIASRTYLMLYRVAEPLYWLLYALVTMELFRLLFRRYSGIAAVGRIAIAVSLILAASMSTLSILGGGRRATMRQIMDAYLLADRSVALTIFLFLALMMMFLAWFPVPLSRNIIAYSIGYTVYFCVHSIAYFLVSVQGLNLAATVEPVQAAITLGCLIYWLFNLSAAGEADQVTVSRLLNSDDRGRLVEQLDTINASLARITRNR